MAGGPMAGGPPQPRMMSGRPREQAGDPSDTLTVRLTYDDLVDPRPPMDQPVVLVAYKYDQTVTAQVVKSDGAGRAVFTGLDRAGATSYFAMTTLARGDVHDRLTSGPILMIGEAGQRLMLSGEKRDSGTPAVDDLSQLSPQPPDAIAPVAKRSMSMRRPSRFETPPVSRPLPALHVAVRNGMPLGLGQR